MILDLGRFFGFCGCVFGLWKVFLESGTCFGFWEVFLDSGKCFALTSHRRFKCMAG